MPSDVQCPIDSPTLFNADSWMSCRLWTKHTPKAADFRSVLSECGRLPSTSNLLGGGSGSPFVEPNEFLGADRAAMCELQRARRRIMRSTGRRGVWRLDESALVVHRLTRIISKLRTILGRAAFDPGRFVVSSISRRSATTRSMTLEDR